MKIQNAVILLLLTGMPITAAAADDLDTQLSELRQMLAAMRSDYESRISELEARLDNAEQRARSAERQAGDAFELAEQTAIDQTASRPAANAFNPALGAVLAGRFADLDAGWEAVPGFQPAGEIGTGGPGFSLGEAEINLKANVDAKYFGNLTFALASEDGEIETELEEAWLQTTDLPAGWSLTAGRFFSAAGYLNGFHVHADDFADRPLPYRSILGGRYTVDGLQLRWLAPTALLLEVGAELNWGASSPAALAEDSSPGATTLFAKTGGDVGDSHSWQAGIAHIAADVESRNAEDFASFSGDSDVTGFDFVWKWAPRGNSEINNAKIQGEYFRRRETGAYDAIAYDGDQDSWYLQGVWQFARAWRVGLRYDTAHTDNGDVFAGTDLEDPGRDSWRSSVMLDWSPSEFSRLRLQYTDDHVLTEPDRQLYLQYIMSIGAHGAHRF